jgi:hypothetical protein
MVYRLATTGPIPNEQSLIEAMAERVGEIVGNDDSVKTNGKLIHLTGRNRLRGNSITFAPHMVLRALPGDEGLEAAFKALAKDLQGFLTSCGERWPCAGAEPHVGVTDETVDVWWGGQTEADASVRMRPLVRRELGV